MCSIEKAEQQIQSEFDGLNDWMDRYNHIIELGKSLPLIDPGYKTETYLINGCQSQVWLFATYQEGKVLYTADSDAIITKGIVHLLIRVLSGHTPDQILGCGLQFIDRIGLRDHLSPTRANGLTAMIKQMKLYALVFKTKYESKS